MVLQTIQLQGKTKIVGASGGTATVTDGKLDVNATVNVTGSAIEDGVSSSIKATVKDLTNSNPLTTAIVDANGDQITSFGGGTQYTEGDVDASITGTAALVEGAANALVVLTQPLTDTQLRAADVKITLDGESVPVTGTFYQATQPVSLASVPSHDVTNAGTFAVQATGTVTANAGTNLNTSALALESGGNLAEIKTNTDNIPVVGQALMAASTPVVIASNQSAVPVTLTSTTVTGTVAVTQSGTWDEVGINDSGNSITVDQSSHDNFNTNANLQIGNADVTTSNPVPIQPPLSGYLNIAIDQTGNNNAVDVLTMPTTTVTATDLDIRNLVFATDKVDASGSTLAANSGVDIGDVTINNAAGASAVNIQDGGNTITVDGTVTVGSITAGDNNIGNVDVVTLPSIPAGTNNIGDVDILTIAAGTNAIGNVGIVPRTTGGLTTYHLVSAATTNATNIKASAGQVFGWYIYNSNAAARKVVFHNTAGTPTAGASVFFSLMIPPSSGANVFSETGIAFSTGIAITTVTGLADSDSAAVAANDLIINIFYS